METMEKVKRIIKMGRIILALTVIVLALSNLLFSSPDSSLAHTNQALFNLLIFVYLIELFIDKNITSFIVLNMMNYSYGQLILQY